MALLNIQSRNVELSSNIYTIYHCTLHIQLNIFVVKLYICNTKGLWRNYTRHQEKLGILYKNAHFFIISAAVIIIVYESILSDKGWKLLFYSERIMNS